MSQHRFGASNIVQLHMLHHLTSIHPAGRLLSLTISKTAKLLLRNCAYRQGRQDHGRKGRKDCQEEHMEEVIEASVLSGIP